MLRRGIAVLSKSSGACWQSGKEAATIARPIGSIFSSMAAPLAIPAGDTGNVHHVHSADAWTNKLASNPDNLTVVDFTATWCGPCKMMAPVFVDLSKKFDGVLFLKVDVDELPDVTAQWKVQAMPTFLFIKSGYEKHRVVGADKKELEAKLEELS